MIWNVIRILLIIWVVRLIYKWYKGYRAHQRRQAFDAGKRAGRGNNNGRGSVKPDDGELGEFIDYEELP